MGKRFQHHALALRVLAVAVEGSCGDWAAYIDAVPGNCHDEEARAVAEHGDKLRKDVAELLFPGFKDLVYRW